MGNLVNLHAIAALEQETAICAQSLVKGFLGDAMFGFGLRPRFWADYSPEDSIKVHMEAYRDYRVLTFDLHEHPRSFRPPSSKRLAAACSRTTGREFWPQSPASWPTSACTLT
jgi:hypothetical protein